MTDRERTVARDAPLLVLEHARKSFGPVPALLDASLELNGGEAHALVGENGAGKSTLVRILAGVHRPDAGRLAIGGEPVTLGGPADARARGIAVIYQEPTLFPDLSVAENIFMGRQPRRAGRRIDTRRMHREVAALLGRLGMPLRPDRPARGLSIADQQIVEIAKALSFDARVIVMDEPTAALSGVEVTRLFSVVAALRSHGAAVLFVSHRLDEVFALCQRVTVMRDGRQVFTGPPNLKGIISPTTVGIAAAARYLDGSTYKGKVALTGLGDPDQMRKFVKDGTVQSFELWDPGKLGYLAAYAAAALVSGQISGAEGETFTAGSLDERTIGKQGVVLLGPPQVFDSSNIDQFKF